MRFENQFVQPFNLAIQEQYNHFIESGTTYSVHPEPIYKVLVKLWSELPMQWAKQVVKRAKVEKDGGQMGFSEIINRLMQAYFETQLLQDAENITQTTIDYIQRILKESSVNGKGHNWVVQQLKDSQISATRARLISRTETTGASNYAALMAANADNLYYDKTWIASKDNRTRDSHRPPLDGTTIHNEDHFNVGGYQMMYPGDKAGGPDQVCNCRCCLGFTARRDENDRLLFKP